MILYLSSNDNTNLLDFMEWSEDGGSHTVKKMVGNFILKQFVLYDMRNFSHCTEIILDRMAFGDTDMEFAEAVREFLMMYQVRISVILEGLKFTDFLFGDLLNSGVGNLVVGTTYQEIQTEIRECLSEMGMQRYQVKEKILIKEQNEQYSFDCENVKIVFISAVSRIGVTSTAIGMTSWLASVGAKVVYVEANESRHLSYVARVYDMEEKIDGYCMDNASYDVKEPLSKENFILYDIGYPYYEQFNLVSEADILVLLCGTKPYELAGTFMFLKEFDEKRAIILCPFVDDKNRENIEESFTTRLHQVLFSEYQPDFFDEKANAEQFKRIIDKYITGA